MPDFWRSSGYHLLERDGAGRLAVTDDFLRAYYLRPEMRPVEESCAAERSLHAVLMEAPRRAVAPEEIAAIADPDARDNYRLVLRFRERLLAAGTLESCYAGLFSGAGVDIPPLFVDQLVHAVLRNILDGCEDAVVLRAAELFFREQKAGMTGGEVEPGRLRRVLALLRLEFADVAAMHAELAGRPVYLALSADRGTWCA